MKCIAVLLILAACKHGSTPERPSADTGDVHSALATDEEPPPSYDQAAIGKALSTERAAEASAEREVSEAEAGSDDHRLRIAVADLAVRRRFITILELCEAQSRFCPPRLDEPPWPYEADSEVDPKLDVPLRFDLASWQKVTAELHGRACACRTLSCIDSMDATIERLETRPVDEVQADDTATVELTRARECLFRLRGRKPLPRVATE